MKFAPVGRAANIGKQAGIISRRFEAPTPLVQTLRCEVDGVVAELKAGLCGSGEGAEGTSLNLRLGSAVGEAIFHFEVDGSAERVQPKHRVVGPQISAVDGDGRNEIPVDSVAKRLVEADPAHINRNALRGA